MHAVVMTFAYRALTDYCPFTFSTLCLIVYTLSGEILRHSPAPWKGRRPLRRQRRLTTTPAARRLEAEVRAIEGLPLVNSVRLSDDAGSDWNGFPPCVRKPQCRCREVHAGGWQTKQPAAAVVGNRARADPRLCAATGGGARRCARAVARGGGCGGPHHQALSGWCSTMCACCI